MPKHLTTEQFFAYRRAQRAGLSEDEAIRAAIPNAAPGSRIVNGQLFSPADSTSRASTSGVGQPASIHSPGSGGGGPGKMGTGPVLGMLVLSVVIGLVRRWWWLPVVVVALFMCGVVGWAFWQASRIAPTGAEATRPLPTAGIAPRPTPSPIVLVQPTATVQPVPPTPVVVVVTVVVPGPVQQAPAAPVYQSPQVQVYARPVAAPVQPQARAPAAVAVNPNPQAVNPGMAPQATQGYYQCREQGVRVTPMDNATRGVLVSGDRMYLSNDDGGPLTPPTYRVVTGCQQVK